MTITTIRTVQDADIDAAWDALIEARRTKADVWAAEQTLQVLADHLDRTLCAWCLTPKDVEVRSCCGVGVCADHEEDHDGNADNACPDFAAQLREGA